MIYAGIDLGGTTIKAALVDEIGHILCKKAVPTGAERPHREVVLDMARLVLTLISESHLTLNDIVCIGIGSPGAIDPENGKIILARNFGDFKDVPVVDIMHELLPGKPIFIDNDANVAALGESLFGAGKGSKNSVMITLGTGLGGGIVWDGKIMSGFWHGGAELGHQVIVADGEPCTCGQKGCWEAYSSVTAMIRICRRFLDENPDVPSVLRDQYDKLNGKVIFSAFYDKDPIGVKTVTEYFHYLAIGLGNTVNVFQPEYLIIGGGPSGEGQVLIDYLEPLVKENIFEDTLKTQLVIAQMGNDAGAIGAAMMGKIAFEKRF